MKPGTIAQTPVDPSRSTEPPFPHRDSSDLSVLVLDGYGISISVSRGHLILRDGVGRNRRERRLSRAQRQVTRIVILGETGYISLEATHWCGDVGITIVQLDTRGQIYMTGGMSLGRDDPRLRRSQAAAANGHVGVKIARNLIATKLKGQSVNLERYNLGADESSQLTSMSRSISDATALSEIAELEAAAAIVYFGRWTGSVFCRFAARDASRVPSHWKMFTTRATPISPRSRTPRSAADPINALLNYGYGLAEIECTLALRALGLDPGLGIIHTDKPNRDSLALDLLEVTRPVVEDRVLQLLSVRSFTVHDAHETRQGACRLLPPVTHQLAEWLPFLAREIAPHAEFVAHALAQASPAPIELRTPLTRSNRVRAQTRGKRSANRQEVKAPDTAANCRGCGTPLLDPQGHLCPTCWPIERRQLAAKRATKGVATLAAMRAGGLDPTNSSAARAKRATSLSIRKQEELAWAPDADDASWTRERYKSEVLPHLTRFSLSEIQAATSLSLSACSRIRAGKLIPHKRHWRPLQRAALSR